MCGELPGVGPYVRERRLGAPTEPVVSRPRLRSTPGSVFAMKGRTKLYIKLHGVTIPTGYQDTAQGRKLATLELERLYEAFRRDYYALPGTTSEARLRYWLDDRRLGTGKTRQARANEGKNTKKALHRKSV